MHRTRYVRMPTSAPRLVLLSAGAGFCAALAFVAGLVTTDPAGLGGWTGDAVRLLGLWIATGAAFTAAQLGIVLALRAHEGEAAQDMLPVRIRRDR